MTITYREERRHKKWRWECRMTITYREEKRHEARKVEVMMSVDDHI